MLSELQPVLAEQRAKTPARSAVRRLEKELGVGAAVGILAKLLTASHQVREGRPGARADVHKRVQVRGRSAIAFLQN